MLFSIILGRVRTHFKMTILVIYYECMQHLFRIKMILKLVKSSKS